MTQGLSLDPHPVSAVMTLDSIPTLRLTTASSDDAQVSGSGFSTEIRFRGCYFGSANLDIFRNEMWKENNIVFKENTPQQWCTVDLKDTHV